MLSGKLVQRGDYSGFLVGYSCRHAGLIKGYRNGYLRNTLSQRLQHRVQPRMGDTDRGLLQQLQLWRPLDDDGIAGNRSDLLGVKLVPYRKNQLSVFMLGDTGYNHIEDVGPAIH